MPRRLLLILTAAVACGGEPPPPVDSTMVPEMVLEAAPSGSVGCRLEGLWAWCSVLDRLERAGVVLTPREDVAPSDLLTGERRAFTVGAGEDELHVFLYPTVAARLANTGLLDSATVSPKGERRPYRVQPLLVTSNNVAALVFTMNERTSERLSLAISAGLPQPRR